MGKAKPAAVIETLADLTPDPRNARRHNPRNVGMLEKALGEVGAARSIVIDERGVVLAGNATIEAAGRAGIEKVQVVDADGETIIAVRRTGLTAKQKTRLALYDNRTAELADWDADVIADLLATERELLDGLFADDELAELLDDLGDPETVDAEPKIDRAAELNKKWQVKPGDLWRVGEHRLLCGDSTKREDVERVMGGEKAQLVFADPPYGMNLDPRYDAMHTGKGHRVTGDRFNAVIGDAEPFNPQSAMCHWDEVVEQIWWGADYYRQHLPIGGGWFVWDKRDNDSGMNLDAVHGSSFELAWSKQPHRREIARILWSGHHGMQGADKGERVHPTQKPVSLAIWFFNRLSAEIVADPFLGSGTTMVACENLQRKCRGIEISADYCAVILERMATAFPALAIERA